MKTHPWNSLIPSINLCVLSAIIYCFHYLLSKIQKHFVSPNSRINLVEDSKPVIVFPMIDIRYWPLTILFTLCILAGLFSANKKCNNHIGWENLSKWTKMGGRAHTCVPSPPCWRWDRMLRARALCWALDLDLDNWYLGGL